MLNNIGEACTACRACEQICPNSAIIFEKDEYGNIYPQVLEDKCTWCGLCNSVCHVQNTVSLHTITKYYAGFSNDEDRKNSASGGICAAIYQMGLKEGYKVFGVIQEENFQAKYIEIRSSLDIVNSRNSKYTYSDMRDCFYAVLKYLKQNEKVIFIGLPCQLAALKCHVNRILSNSKKLFLVELMCHGIASHQYLLDHMRQIEKRTRKQAKTISFRDPAYGTEKHIISCRDERKKLIYHSSEKQGDEYQIGYHNGVIYRENCYSCRYTGMHRNGDLLLADWYRDRSAPEIKFQDHSVNSIFVCSDSGEAFLEHLVKNGYIQVFERPLSEALKIQRTLHKPTERSPLRDQFLSIYKETKDFDKSIRRACRGLIRKKKINHYLKVSYIKCIAVKLSNLGE